MRRYFQQPGTATVWIACLLAAALAAGGLITARRTERQVERPPGNRVDDIFRQTVAKIDSLEGRWREALEGEAAKSLGESRILPAEDGRIPEAMGITRRTYLNPSRLGEDHTVFAGHPPCVPILARFAKGQPGEWPFEDAIIQSPGELIEVPGKPPAYARGDGKRAVVFLLDPAAVSPIVTERVAGSVEAMALKDEPGGLQWRGPDSAPVASMAGGSGRPDEILRHVSIFGPWELRRWYPVRETVSYHTPTVAISLALAGLMVAGGISSAASQRRAIQLAEERVSFVNRVSHELRSPLTNLLLNADLAIDQIPAADEKIRRRLGLIREETGRLSRIVDNVLVFARMERGGERLATSSCDPSLLISEVRESFAPLFARKGIRCDLRNQLPGRLPLDGDALSQIVSNLLSNVEKYAGPGATSTVSASIRGADMIVEVSDDGPGIPGQARKRVFQPFERVHEATREGVSGTGLGLAISRDLAERMGGKLELLEQPRGTTFRLTIPAGTREEPS